MNTLIQQSHTGTRTEKHGVQLKTINSHMVYRPLMTGRADQQSGEAKTHIEDDT